MKKLLVIAGFIVLMIYACDKKEISDGGILLNDTCKILSNETNLLQDGVIITELYTYDDLGREINYKYKSNGILEKENKNYQYDASGNKIYYETFNGSNIKLHIYTLTYNDFHKPLIIETNVVRYALFNKVVYTYNKSGWETSYKRYINEELHEEKKNYQYDPDGNITYFEKFDSDNKKTEEVTKTYFAQNKPSTIETNELSSGLILKEVYSYNDSGWIDGTKYYTNHLLVQEIRNYTHDSKGYITFYEIFNIRDLPEENDMKVSEITMTYQCFE